MKIFFVGTILLAVILGEPLASAFPMYHDISDHDQAQAEARQRNLPLAWLGSYPEALNNPMPSPGSTSDLTQLAMAALQGKAVVIFFDGRNMAPVPPNIHAQFHIHDDTGLKDGVDWMSPKVVFTNPEATNMLGRVCFTQMGTDREAAINSALQIIKNTPDALAPPAPDSQPMTTPNSAPDKGDALESTLSSGFAIVSWLNDYGLYLAMGAVVLIGGLIMWLMSRSQRP